MELEQRPKHYASTHGGNSALELFQIPPTDTSILSARWQPYYPESRIQRGSPIEFNIETTPDYIDLSKCYMKFKLKITKANGADITDKKVIPVNNFLHTMIKQMSIKLNNTLVTQQNDTYAYKAYMESLLSYPKDSAESYLTCVLWYKDVAGSFDIVETSAGTAGADVPSLVARQEFIDGSKILQVQGTPAHALFHTDKYLVGDVTINIRIDLQSEAFCLMSTAGTERVEILNAEFMVRYVKISDTVRLQHIAIMSGAGRKHPQPALYPLERGDVQAYNIAQGQSSFQKNDLFLGKVPRRVVVGLVRNDAYVGDRARNPFNFQLFNLKSLKLLVNGEEYPTPGIELEDHGNVNGYNSLFLGSGTMHRGQGIQVERREWHDGYALFTWDLTPDGSGNSTHLHPDYRGQVTIKGVFTQGLNTVVTLIVYGEFVDIMEIDANKNVTYDLA